MIKHIYFSVYLIALFMVSGCDLFNHKTPVTCEPSAIIIEDKDGLEIQQVAQAPVVHSLEKVESIRELIAQNPLVVVDFYAPWCGPCKFMSPIIEQLSCERSDITFVKVDIDKLDSVFTPFELGGKQVDISSVPTFYLFKNGLFAQELHGGMDKELFIQKIDNSFK